VNNAAADKAANGYLYVRINGSNYIAHRLAWLFATGRVPGQMIDHINGVKTDNRFANLRDESPAVNSQNVRGLRVNNSSGFHGVYFHKASGKWMSQIRVQEKGRLTLGLFPTPTLASQAYEAARKLHHPGYVGAAN